MGLSVLYVFLELIGIGMVYKFIFHARFVKKPLRYVVGSVVVIGVECVLYLTQSEWEGTYWIICFGWLFPFFFIERLKGKMVLYFQIVYMGFSLVSVIFAYVWSFLTGIAYTEIIHIPLYQMLIDITVLLILGFYGFVRRKRKYVEVQLSVGQFLILFIGMISFLFIIGFAQILETGISYTESSIKVIGIFLNITAMLFITLSIWQQVIWKRAQEYRLQNELYENYLKMQEEHIRDVIQEDEKMRRFRHDFHAHMTAIKMLVQDNRMEELKQYVESMEDINLWQAQKFTGLSAVDAVIGEIYQKAQDKHISWKWEGSLQNSEKIEQFSLCVLFSNLLNNALEACEKLEGAGEIKIKVGKFQDKSYISVSNTCQKDLTVEALSTTSKGDTKNHGLGLQNVREIVEKQKGSIELRIEDDWFHAEVII